MILHIMLTTAFKAIEITKEIVGKEGFGTVLDHDNLEIIYTFFSIGVSKLVLAEEFFYDVG